MRLAAVLALAVLAMAAADTVLSRVNDALEAGEITTDQAVRYLWDSIHDRSSLPADLAEGAVEVPCGTATMDRISVLLDDCTVPVREEMLDILSRPDVGDPEYTYDTPDGNFKIHWTDTGINATTQNWVETIGEGMEYAWEQECNVLDWDEPPSDLGLGGDERLDVYILHLEGGVIGWCSNAGNPPDPSTPENDYASHIAMSNSESWGTLQIQSTCAHEFKHAIQNGYEAAEPSWFKENCATWMEYMVGYPTYASYLHGGDNCLRRPWYDIRTMDEGLYEYGATPWPMYMAERCSGNETVRLVWEEAASVVGADIMAAIDRAAQAEGMSFMEWLAEYAAWRWFTGNNASDNYYPIGECSLWTPGPYTFAYHTFDAADLPVSGDEGVYRPETYGHHWIWVDVSGFSDWITFDFDGRDNFPWHVGVISTNADHTTTQFQWHEVDNTGATISLGAATEGWDDVVFYVQPTYETTLYMTYDFTIEAQTGVGSGPAFDIEMTPASNPIASGQAIDVSIPTAGRTTLNVYDMSGRMVQSIYSGQLPEGESSLVWDAGNLSSGTYFLMLSAPGGGLTSQVVLSN